MTNMMPTLFKQTLVVLLLLLGRYTTVHAQVNLAKDLSFFVQKAPEFNKLLIDKGLNKYLQVDLVRMQPLKDKSGKYIGIDSTELELLLLLKTNDPDSALVMWQALKQGFDTPEDSLENFLYRTFVHQMEIPGVQGSVQIYIKNQDGFYSSTFYVWIWEDIDPILGRKVKSRYVNGTRAKSFEITVQPTPTKTSGKGKSSKIVKPKVKTAPQVFETIRKYAIDSILQQPRYRTDVCNDRIPHFEDSLRTANSFRFTLADLGQEVLKNQYRSFWERFWGYNSIAMERLSFQFEYYPIDKGFILKCVIEGKYGSGVFKPRTTGYMNMETDFDDFFEQYKNQLRQELQKRL
jgi:hypothetical protein